MRALDEVLPAFDHVEAHAVDVQAAPEAAVAACLGGSAGAGVAARVLLRLRGIRAGRSIEDLLAGLGFEVLRRTATEVVLGGAGRPWTPRGGIHPFDDAQPGEVRVALDVRAVPRAGGGCVLSTETRIAAVDEHARRAFGRYWRVVRPFSGLVRRRWLRQAARAAARS